MKMDVAKFKKVIDSNKLPKVFNSHEFLQMYRRMFEEDYIKNTPPEKGGFRKLHGPIGSYLRRKEAVLGIHKIEPTLDKNIKGYKSKCALWEKVKK